MNKVKSIAVLNTLIEINNDRIEAYETALNGMDEGHLKTKFSHCIQTSTICKEELSKEVDELVGIPFEKEEKSRTFYKARLGFKTMLKDKHRDAISLYNMGAGFAVETYKKVLRSNRRILSPKTWTMLNNQISLIMADHN